MSQDASVGVGFTRSVSGTGVLRCSEPSGVPPFATMNGGLKPGVQFLGLC